MEELLQKPYWVIDFLPRQVPAKSGGQFFAVEEYYLRSPLRRRFAEVLLKLNCYYEARVCEPETEKWQVNPPPERLFAWIAENEKDLRVLLPAEDTLLTVNRDDLYMTVYGPSRDVLELLRPLSAAAGLFLWQPPQEGKE
ncbi:MAG: hypothetical protein IJU12_06475 [Clostridia bacterium]|nr:hypothetical protein [Clostridia bacterium]